MAVQLTPRNVLFVYIFRRMKQELQVHPGTPLAQAAG